MDLAALIKPVLVAGELRVIGSTTFEEFKHIERDRALARRLQKVAIDEPSVEETVRILKGLQRRYEEHHHVRYTDEAIDAAARLAGRHLRDLRLPDSAIDLLDEAGAMTRIESRRRAASSASAADGGQTERRPPSRARSARRGRVHPRQGRFTRGPDVSRADSDRRGRRRLEPGTGGRRAVGRRRPRDRAHRRAHGQHPRPPGVRVRQAQAAHARGVAAARGVRAG